MPDTLVSPPPVIYRTAKKIMLGIMLELRRATLVGGDPAPVTVKARERMVDVRPGDLVIEASTAYWLLYRDPELKSSKWDGQFITYLKTVREERVVEEETMTDTFLVCLNPDGTEFSWYNAELLAVPDGLSVS